MGHWMEQKRELNLVHWKELKMELKTAQNLAQSLVQMMVLS
jgi:hypothetical protein